nr:unnamed protein product [Callosobruchus chinensis]
MDRSLYGKTEPGALNPYQCSIKRGTLPGSFAGGDRRRENPSFVVFLAKATTTHGHPCCQNTYRCTG